MSYWDLIQQFSLKDKEHFGKYLRMKNIVGILEKHVDC